MSIKNIFFLLCFTLLILVVLSGCGWFDDGEEEGEAEEGYQGVIVLPVPSNGSDYYYPDEILYFSVIDFDLMESNEVVVHVTSLSNLAGIDITCNQEGNGGIFTGGIYLSNDYTLENPNPDVPVSYVGYDDIVSLYYYDENPEATIIKSASVY